MANVPTYLMPIAGATAPTAQQVQGKSRVSAAVQTDGATANVTITHNMGLSAAELAKDLPDVKFQPKAATFYAQTVFVVSKNANTVVLGTAGTVAVNFDVILERPTTAVR